jgi:hypothetical protein
MAYWKTKCFDFKEAMRIFPELMSEEHIFEGKMKLYNLKKKIDEMP